MTFTRAFIEGLAEYLADDPSPLVYQPTGAYASTDFGVYAQTAPLAKIRPLSLVVRVYGSYDDVALSDSTLAVQLDFYGPAVQVLDAIDDAFDRLQGLQGGILGGVKVQTVDRTYIAVMGQDEAGNLRQTENYELAVHRPSTNRT